MGNKNSPKLSPLGELIQFVINYEADTKYFGTRKELNRELLTYLRTDPDFKIDVKKFKHELKIPKLNPETDVDSFEDGNYIDAESFWLRTQEKSIRNKFEEGMRSLLGRYGLPIGFYDWLQYLVLYGQPPWTPLYNVELANDIFSSPEELQRVPLTTQEKKYVRRTVKSNIGIKGRPSKKVQALYQSFLEALSESKNSRRRFRSLSTAIKTAKLGEIRNEYDSYEGKNISRKITSSDLATNIYNDPGGHKSHVVRKQKQRLKERKTLITKKVEK